MDSPAHEQRSHPSVSGTAEAIHEVVRVNRHQRTLSPRWASLRGRGPAGRTPNLYI